MQTQVESSGNSSYNALWVTANHRLARGVQFNASYTWSKSLDYNSLSLQGIVVQNSYDLRGFRVGYEDPSYFSRDYKKLFGSPPQRDIVSLRSRLDA